MIKMMIFDIYINAFNVKIIVPFDILIIILHSPMLNFVRIRITASFTKVAVAVVKPVKEKPSKHGKQSSVTRYMYIGD